MSQTLQRPMTRKAFLAWEERQPVRYEFDGAAVRAMTGGSANHARVQRFSELYAGVELVTDTTEPDA